MSSSDELNKLVSTIQMLKNRDLMSICSACRVTKSGNKAELQRRIINLIDAAIAEPGTHEFETIKNTIMQVADGSTAGYRTAGYFVSPGAASTPSSPSYGMSSPYAKHTVGGAPSSSTKPGASSGLASGAAPATSNGYSSSSDLARRQLFLHQGLQFKASPFYEILNPIGDIQTCEAMTQHRNSISISIRASAYPELQRLATEPTHRIMVFCAGSNQGPQDISFPYQCEIKLNTGEVKANLRGLKNKPGSTRPADITEYLRLKPSTYINTLEFTYALTTKRFYLGVFVCNVFSATVLAGRIEKRSRITKESVVREITKQAQDPDIVATSYVLSLKCPLTYMRLALPVRATTCKHIQCFDATSYLLLQEQGPQWLCPVCSNPAPFDSLAVDEYVKDIMENTSSDLEQVTIDPDGTWHTGGRENGGNGSNGSNGNHSRNRKSGANGNSTPPYRESLTLDDELEILITPTQNGGSSSSTDATTARHGANGSTTFDTESRDTTVTPARATTSSAPPGSTNNKRTREVIDLTLSSDDEDDEPPRPLKRQNLGPSSSLLYNNPSM
ncbi:miz zinc finger protein [Ophiostoma piceae UAMH 11346]|uniref:Miz zinc finger protein n=1 Tax=Ophiostoma piceae (strain UAMH 11346) TaxID=1262450 RepID=S3C383_OPHP1|nr:miz zinc finger protein [Ophiostoma piceae UAMH 11346]